MMATKKKIRKRNKSKDEVKNREEFHSDDDENIPSSGRNTVNYYKVNSDFSQYEIPNTNIEESNETQNKPNKKISMGKYSIKHAWRNNKSKW